MRHLRGLVVDEDDENATTIRRRLNFELNRLGCSTDWTVKTDQIEAREAVRDSDAFDFAVVDLFLNTQRVKDGLDIVRDIQEKDDRTFALIVTSHADWSPGFREEAQEHGAYAIDRDELLRSPKWTFGNLAVLIRDHVVSVGLVDIVAINYDKADPAVVSLIQRLGDSVNRELRLNSSSDDRREAGLRVIRNLAIRCLGTAYQEDVSLWLRYLTPGRSGAHVCRVDVKRPGEPEQAFVLKFGLDKRMLELEVMANSEARKILGEQFLVMNIGDVQSDISGYHGIAARAAQGAIPLSQWLSKVAEPVDATRVAEVLLGELLAPLFQEGLRDRVSFQKWLNPTPVEIVRARRVIDSYVPALADSRAGRRQKVATEMRRLQTFLAGMEFPENGSLPVPEHVIFVRSFGDLHSGNVLVYSRAQPRPILIDAALYSSRHWAADIARLVVDLFLRVRRPGVDSMIWNDMDASVEAGLRLCPLGERGTAASASATEAFLSYAVMGLPRFTHAKALGVLDDDWHWQWHVALAKEFLRQSSHEDLTPPRSALALLLASRHLRKGYVLLRAAGRNARSDSGGALCDQAVLSKNFHETRLPLHHIRKEAR